MLQKLSGKAHAVITGFTIIDAKTNKIITRSEETKVTMREISKGEIDSYLKTGEPFDKAGGYGVQEWIGYIGISRIEGSFFNVMGLPVKELYEELLKF